MTGEWCIPVLKRRDGCPYLIEGTRDIATGVVRRLSKADLPWREETPPTGHKQTGQIGQNT